MDKYSGHGFASMFYAVTDGARCRYVSPVSEFLSPVAFQETGHNVYFLKQNVQIFFIKKLND